MLYITTSNGVYYFNPETRQISAIMTNKHTPGFLKKKAFGYFGICFNKVSNKIIVASREKLGTKRINKPATDTKLHEIDPTKLSHNTIAVIYDIHDVHQIDCHNNYVYLSDTGKNRVPIYSITEKRVTMHLNVGKDRTDINHINAITCQNDKLNIGLNNRGNKLSEIYELPYTLIEKSAEETILAETIAKIHQIPGLFHSHDLEPFNQYFLMCASHDGFLIRSDTGQSLTKIGDWTRGIAISENEIWISASQYAKRSKRHSKTLDGYLYRVDRNDFKILERIVIPKAGQINDLLYLTNDSYQLTLTT